VPTMTQAGYTPPKQEPKKQQAPRSKKKKKKKGRKGLNGAAVFSLLVFFAAVLIGAATIFVYTQTQPYVYAYCPGTSLDNYPLAGASQEDALELLRRTTQERVQGWQFEMTWGEYTYALTAQDVGLHVDEAATLDPLWQAGRSGGMFARYAQMLRLRREPMNAEPVIVYDLSPAKALLERIEADISREPSDAAVTFSSGSSTPFRFTDEAEGYAMDVSPLLEQIEQSAAGLTSVRMELVPEVLEPAVTRESLEQACVLRARVTMEIAADEASYTNASIALNMLDGVRVEAGEELSFNAVVGRRAAEAGYVQAMEPAYGADVSGTGGGVCQVSTALYRSALQAGLTVLQRSAAVRPVPYCPMGQEAAVSDQGLDLVIENNTPSALFIAARAYRSGDAAYAQIDWIGAPLHTKYVLESQTESLGMIEEPVYVRDSEGKYAQYTDERIEAGKAQEGFRVRVERVVHGAAGEEPAREVIGEYTYEPVPPTVYVGIQEREN